MKKLFKTGLMVVMAASVAASAAASDETKMEEERAKHRKEVAEQLTEMARLLTPFDYVAYNMSGPVVVLQGFATKPSIKDDAEKAVRELDWVTHVVNEIDFIPGDPAGNDIRSESLSILKKACPQAFPQNHAYIRIKVDQAYNITLVGWIDPGDEQRLEAAVVRIGHLPLVKGVDNKILTKKK